MQLYKFIPIYKSVIWGGDRIGILKHSEESFEKIGESWELSAVRGYESVVMNGEDQGLTLRELIHTYQEKIVGRRNYAKYGEEFPLLVKFIDAKEDLSVQVHPNDEMAMSRHQSFGKTEMWYVMDNNQGNAHLYTGLKQEITPIQYASMVKDHTICDALSRYQVGPGDVFFLPAGRIHSIGAGCLIAEIQQTSDITYRIYDFGRKDAEGNERELHTELAKGAIDYRVESNYRTEYTLQDDGTALLVSCPYFTTHLYQLENNKRINYKDLDSFVIFICVEGSCSINYNTDKCEEMHAGETLLIPAEMNELEVQVTDKVKLLEVYVE